MSKTGILRPPFTWVAKGGLIEDQRYVRWSEAQIRDMKNGVYDWSKHQEIRSGEAGLS